MTSRALLVTLLLLVKTPYAEAGRSLNTTVTYVGTIYSQIGMTLSITNAGSVPQTIKVDGGMRLLLDTFGSEFAVAFADLGLTPGAFNAGWAMRGGAPISGVTNRSPGSAHTYSAMPRPPLPTNAACKFCPGMPAPVQRPFVSGGVGTSTSATDGPRATLAPGASVFLQSEKYGAGAHGIYEIKITVDEDRGALQASGEVYAFAGDVCGCYTTDATTRSVLLNGGRPF